MIIHMKLYHRTNAAEAILEHGFKDSSGFYMTDRLHSGVWLSDRPLDDNEGADGDVLFCLAIPEDVVKGYEWIEEGKPYREFLVPAMIVNAYGKPQVIDDEDLVDDSRWS